MAEEWQKQLEGGNLPAKTTISEQLLEEMGIEKEEAPVLKETLAGNRIRTWGLLLDLETKDKAIQSSGNDEVNGTRIWNYVQDYKTKAASARERAAAPAAEKWVPEDDHTTFVREVSNAEIVEWNGSAQPDKIYWQRQAVVKGCEDDLDEGVAPSHICIITLPVPIVGLRDKPSPNQLFFLQGDLQVLQLAAKGKKINVLVGNPGIGKSILQWKLLVLWLRPELWGILCDIFNTASLQATFPLETNFPFGIFKRIIRVVNARSMFMFHSNHESAPVLESKFSDLRLKHVIDDETLVLWEPAGSLETIPYSNLDKLHLIATVSPDQRRYKEVIKDSGGKIYVPCPTNGELLAIGRSIYERSNGNELYEEKAILERLGKFGPFTRYVFPASEDDLIQALEARSTALDKVDAKTPRKCATIEKGDDPGNYSASHFFLRFVINRDDPKSFLKPSYKPASKDFQFRLAHQANAVNLEELCTYLTNGGDSHADMWNVPIALQSYVVGLLYTREKTTFVSYPLLRDGAAKKTTKKSTISLKKMRLERVYEVPKYVAMEPSVIYYPTNPRYPIGDIFWRDKNGLNVGQVSVSENHPHPPEAYEKLLANLGVLTTTTSKRKSSRSSAAQAASGSSTAKKQKLACMVNYVYFTWPRNENLFAQQRPLSSFFSDVTTKKVEIERLRDVITFRSCIVPLNIEH